MVHPPFLPEDWVPFDDAYIAFAKRHRQTLHLTETNWGAVYVRRKYGSALIDAGAMLRVAGRALANRQTFDSTLFDLMLRASSAPLERAREAARAPSAA